ncbi:hypothetical protein [Pseudoflavonifractor phocaeensis]|uniref:hypothetical protein n=1 Tax=Pseudoflavonifractor phocaeensis TaxID=1870988 RepID=UPI001F25E1E2|nr:hypothetical protein [Pseudoflavonifractor phocaeensis]MCF2661200.1 hypothetical protein [Pseudoflavonifractor phocaeensis]
MFGRKKKQELPPVDITKKLVKTWWGGKKFVPTTKREQREMKKALLKANPKLTIIDDAAKKEKELEWIDRIEDYDAML